jgi:hypothetical protein
VLRAADRNNRDALKSLKQEYRGAYFQKWVPTQAKIGLEWAIPS